jgi:hypothetical protein
MYKSLTMKYRKTNETGDIVAARIKFLKAVHNLRFQEINVA